MTAGNGRYTGQGQNLGNDLEEITKFITSKMDDIISIEAKTSGMTADPALVEATSTAGVVKLGTLETTGLGNYSKINGYPVGSVQLTFQEYTLANDRAIAATIDRRDMQTTGGLVSAAAALATTMRREVVPELDACRMAKFYTELNKYNASNANVVSMAKPTAANVIGSIITGINDIAARTGIDSGMQVYVNSDLMNIVDQSEQVTLNKDVSSGNQAYTRMNRVINGQQLIYVPPARMKTVCTLNDGYTTALPDDTVLNEVDKTKYGFATSGKDIWFAINTPGVANAITTIENTKIVTADVNQRYDGDTFYYRIYHDLIVPKNQAAAAYMAIKNRDGQDSEGEPSGDVEGQRLR